LITSEYVKVQSTLEGTREYLQEIRKTNDSLLTTKQNEIMKTLTIMAFVTFPLTVITGTFGMNTTHTPILGLHGDFWIVIGIMITMTSSFFIYFIWKKWL
jgi:magnesium transporter